MTGTDPRVSAHWLSEHCADPDVVILDARIQRGIDHQGATFYASGRADFEQAGHIPGAHFADLFGAFSDPDGRFSFTRPQAAQLQAELRCLGISAHSHVVVYDSLNGVWAARVWWLLLAYGHARASVLDGGLGQWQASGAPLAFGPATAAATGDALAREVSGHFVDLPQVRAWLAQPKGAQLICGLRSSEYVGGHIPGSLSLPYADWLDEHGKLCVERVQRSTQALHISPGDDLTLYCGGGVNACGLALGLVAAGFAPASLHIYDGSLNEWRADPALPLSKGLQP